jgi:hypothetical protein
MDLEIIHSLQGTLPKRTKPALLQNFAIDFLPFHSDIYMKDSANLIVKMMETETVNA